MLRTNKHRQAMIESQRLEKVITDKHFPKYRINGEIPKGHQPFSSMLVADYGQYRFQVLIEFTAGSQKSAHKKINLINKEWQEYLRSTPLEVLLERKEFTVTMTKIKDDEKEFITPEEIKERISNRIAYLRSFGMQFDYPTIHHLGHKDAKMHYTDVVELPDGLFKNKVAEIKKLISPIITL